MARRKESATAEIKIRMKEPLRADIEKTARRRGVSMNSEMVERLERSIRDDELIGAFHQAIYGRQLGAILIALGRAMSDAGRAASAHSGKFESAANGQWLADPFSFDQATKAAHALIEAFRPPGDRSAPPDPEPINIVGDPIPATPPLLPRIGEGIANGIIDALANPERGGDIGDWAKPVRENLGPLTARMAPFRSMGRKHK